MIRNALSILGTLYAYKYWVVFVALVSCPCPTPEVCSSYAMDMHTSMLVGTSTSKSLCTYMSRGRSKNIMW